jgi:sulfatase modifying factor 1
MGNMKKLLVLLTAAISFSACNTGGDGELTGISGRAPWYDQTPYGMVHVPQGSFTMGPSDDDVPWALNAQSKTVSVSAFWMDETEITNNEYRQFVYWVRDSLAYRLLGEQIDEYLIRENEFGEEIDPPYINWNEPIVWEGQEEQEILADLYYPENERFFRKKTIDPRAGSIFIYYGGVNTNLPRYACLD